METASVTAVMRIQRRDAMWLALAVLLHAALLSIPLRDGPPAPGLSRAISISLFKAPRNRAELDEVRPTAQSREYALPPAPAERPGPETRTTDAEEPEAGEESVDSSAAALLDSLNGFQWPTRADSQSRRLGDFTPPGVPENWRPRITVEDNPFNGMVAPAQTEIVDRWLAADGSQRVVVNTPSGDTLCGRARRWDPMNPLLEPVMNWWKCGGGGKREFRMPDRFMRSNRGPVAPTALP